ncbi:Na+/H+ antiporter NhaC family protein [Hungatella hathewayi]|uniref:Na+/H+ antiporter NhaC family protein n=1 Tax=Hungatella hathewayi TaxID=154046 RepID=UPI000336A4C9|nr:Na+/H+ antiporter NhaC family protein [Hungatella hathewayi]CCZ61932.1 putative uncharacterized protein [Hungatella hathewayi CAG:224]
MEATAISLIPPLIVILLVITTRRVDIFISAGIIASALILCNFQPGEAVEAVMGSAVRIFYTEGNWNFDNVLLVLFILGLGMLTAFIDKNGGTVSFARWAQKRVKNAAMAQLLPCLLFVFSAVMALATGFSWGVFGIMLPISVQMASALGMGNAMLYCCLGAVLSGSVFGDHCFPISDTTILSSTGAQCVHIDHVVSQLPYALFSAVVAAAGFLIIGYTGSLGAAFAAQTGILCAVTFLILTRRKHKNKSAGIAVAAVEG